MIRSYKFIQSSIILCLILFSTGYGGTKMGRKFKSGDRLPDSIIQHLKKNSPESPGDNWKIAFCIFTKKDQHFSKGLKEEFTTSFSKDNQKLFPVWEFNASYANSMKDTDSPGNWMLLSDKNYDFYDHFGVIVHPTLYIINNNYEVIGYFTGYSPTFNQKIYPFFSRYYPKLFPPKKELAPVSAEAKRFHRKEKLIEELYKKKLYSAAKMQVATLDTLSLNGELLHGKIMLQLDENEKAIELFTELSTILPGKSYLGLGIAYYQLKQYDTALEYLNQVKTIPDMYKVHYWKAKCYDKLGDDKKTIREYRKTLRQILIKGNLDPI